MRKAECVLDMGTQAEIPSIFYLKESEFPGGGEIEHLYCSQEVYDELVELFQSNEPGATTLEQRISKWIKTSIIHAKIEDRVFSITYEGNTFSGKVRREEDRRAYFVILEKSA